MKNTIVIGGGIGGLALAAGLRGSGLEPIVLERAPEFRALGAALTLAANAMRALARNVLIRRLPAWAGRKQYRSTVEVAL